LSLHINVFVSLQSKTKSVEQPAQDLGDVHTRHCLIWCVKCNL